MRNIIVPLSGPMLRWVEKQSHGDHSGRAEDYVRTLIQRDLDDDAGGRARGDEQETNGSDIAEQGVEARAEFLSAMSHELRTPLNAILGFGQLLKASPDEPLTPSQDTSVTQIILGGRRLLGLIDEIVELAKAEAGQVDMETQNVPVDEVVAECIEELRETAEQRQIRITTQISNAPTVRANRSRLNQVLRHLMANAVTFNRLGGSVHISTASDTSGMLSLRVLDTGVGIPQDRSRDVFDPFVRLETESETPAGSGIGLSLCRKLIGSMGGNMGFESVPGIGSSFWIELPQVNALESAPPPQSSEATEALFAAPRGKVLYIEDNPANLDLMKAVFERFPNASLKFANDATRGLELIQSEIPDLVLMDIDLPEMDGFEALRRLREKPETNDVPVIAVSASALLEDVRKGFNAGFNHYVTKPFDIHALARAINSAQVGR